MTTIKTLCEICQGHGLIDESDTTVTCSKCAGTGHIETQTPDAIYPKLQMKINKAIAAGEKTVSVDTLDAKLMINEGYVRDEAGTAIKRELGHGSVSMFVTKPEPATIVSDLEIEEIPVSIETAFQDDNNGYGAACEWMLVDDNTEFDEAEFERFAEETYDQWVNDNGYGISFSAFKKLSDYEECKSAVETCCLNHAEDKEDEETLNAIMTAGEAAEEFGLAESTVRQAINREQIVARKSGGTWLILRKHAEARWGKKG